MSSKSAINCSVQSFKRPSPNTLALASPYAYNLQCAPSAVCFFETFSFWSNKVSKFRPRQFNWIKTAYDHVTENLVTLIFSCGFRISNIFLVEILASINPACLVSSHISREVCSVSCCVGRQAWNDLVCDAMAFAQDRHNGLNKPGLYTSF